MARIADSSPLQAARSAGSDREARNRVDDQTAALSHCNTLNSLAGNAAIVNRGGIALPR